MNHCICRVCGDPVAHIRALLEHLEEAHEVCPGVIDHAPVKLAEADDASD